MVGLEVVAYVMVGFAGGFWSRWLMEWVARYEGDEWPDDYDTYRHGLDRASRRRRIDRAWPHDTPPR